MRVGFWPILTILTKNNRELCSTLYAYLVNSVDVGHYEGVMISRVPIYISFLVMGCLPVLGQQALDSLEKKLATEPNDSIRFGILLNLSKEAEFYDYAKSRKYMESAKETSDKINADWAKGDLYFRLALLETIEGDYAEALDFDLQSLKIFSNGKDSSQLFRAMNAVGSDYRDLGQYQEAYFYLTQSYQLARKHKTPSLKDSLVMAISLHNIGTVFTELGQFDIALSHFQASAKLSAKIHDAEGPAYTYDETGELYRKKGSFDLSEKNLLAGLQEVRKLRIRVLIARIQSHLANLYLDKKDYIRSFQYYDSVLVLQTAINNRYGLAECELGKGMVMSRSGNYDEARRLYSKSLATSKELNARNLALTCYKELSALAEIKNDFKNSLYYLKQHDALKDSIFNKATMEKLFQNQVRFETESKDSEIATLLQSRTRQASELRRQELVRNILVIVAALSIILLYSVYRSGRRRKRINRLLLEHQREIKKRSTELEQLNQVKDKFFSIISHDLRSPMNALGSTLELLEQKHISPQEFTELTQSLKTQFNHTRTLINNLLAWTLLQMDKLTVQSEKVFLRQKVEESFTALRDLYPKDILMENNIAENIVCFADPNIVTMILRNFILNSIKFTETGGRIWVNASEIDQEITVSVSDSGIGIKPEVREILFEKAPHYSTRGTANEKGTGLGLILCKEFVEKTGGKIWAESEIGKGSTFYFTLPKA